MECIYLFIYQLNFSFYECMQLLLFFTGKSKQLIRLNLLYREENRIMGGYIFRMWLFTIDKVNGSDGSSSVWVGALIVKPWPYLRLGFFQKVNLKPSIKRRAGLSLRSITSKYIGDLVTQSLTYNFFPFVLDISDIY